ncbi:MAG: sulfate ABC transporter permease subunit CysT [Rhodospirillales bacterium]|nr:sulfate ABC transporter permease subunit CysT [Rhodospirillales bacterium]
MITSILTAPRSLGLRQESVLPGFGLTLGLSVTYLSLVVLIPLASILISASGMSWSEFAAAVASPRALAAYRLSLGAAFLAALVNAVFGLLIAWVLVRYDFPGKRLVDGIVDLPFALPTAVAGIALATLYATNGWVGGLLAPLGVKVAFTQMGVVVALVFEGLPFVVRTVQPVLEDLDRTVEEAAASLGAGRAQTFAKVIFPPLIPAALAGFALAFARGLGEYGSVVFIAGNLPMKSEIVPLLIIIQLEQYDYRGATALAAVMLLASFVLLLLINVAQRWSHRRYAQS